jgi:hypothetical protein
MKTSASLSALAALSVVSAAVGIDCGGTAPGVSAGTPTADAGAPEFPPFGGAGVNTASTWSQPLVGAGLAPAAVRATRTGDVWVAGTISGVARIGAATLSSGGGADVFIAKLDGSGHLIWAGRYGDSMDQKALAADVDDEGNLVVAGTFAGTLGIGGTSLRALGSSDAFVVKIDGNGRALWSASYGGEGANAGAHAVAVGSNGDVAVGGGFDHQVTFATSEAVAATHGGTDAFFALLDGSGRTRWVRHLGSGGSDMGTAVALDHESNVLVYGTYQETIDLGTGALPFYGMTDVFLGKLATSGQTVWSRGFGGPMDDDAVAMAVNTDGTTVTLGNYAITVDLGTGPIPAYEPSPNPPDQVPDGPPFGWDFYVAGYDATGKAVWANHYGSIDVMDMGDALVAGDGHIYVSGHFRDAFPFGSCTVTPPEPGQDTIFGIAFVAELTAGGQPMCGKAYGTGSMARIPSLALTPNDTLLLVGSSNSAVDLGQGEMGTGNFLGAETPFAANQPTQ